MQYNAMKYFTHKITLAMFLSATCERITASGPVREYKLFFSQRHLCEGIDHLKQMVVL